MNPFIGIIHDLNFLNGNSNHTALRKVRLLQQLAEQGIKEFQLFPAIFSNEPACKNISKAHKQIVQYAKDANLPEVLIMEDDVEFTAKGAFDYYLKNKPEDFDMYLGGVCRGEINNGTVNDFAGLQCYIVHSKFYDTFLSADPDKHIDIALEGLGRYVVCEPFPTRQFNGYSYNVKRFCNYDQLFVERNMYK
jgi:hypothetical protein